MFKNLLILFFIIFSISASAQTYTLSGNVYNDVDAGILNNSASIFSIPREKLVVVLVEVNGDTISHNALVNQSTGEFSISNVPPGQYYAILITPNVDVVRGEESPEIILETGWTRTGESLLSNGTPDPNINGRTETITVTSSNVANIKFGVQERPFAYNKKNVLFDNTSNSIVPLEVDTGAVFTQGSDSVLQGFDNGGGVIVNYTINVLPKYGSLYLGMTRVTSLSQVESLSPATFATLSYQVNASSLNQDQDFFTYYVTDNALTFSNNASYVIPFPLLDGDGDSYSNRFDLDDDNDGITDVVECPLNDFGNLATAFMSDQFSIIRPSMFGLTIAHRTGLNFTGDISHHFGYSINSGAIIVSLSNANTHPFANEFYVNDITGPTQWSISGTVGSYVSIVHGLQYFSYDIRSITLLNNTPKYFLMNQTQLNPSQTNWVAGNDGGGSWWLVNDNPATDPISEGNLSLALTDPEPKYFQLSSTANNRNEWSTYFIYILPECDYDMDGVPNRLDLDSDNDGCIDALEGSAGFEYSDASNSEGSVWVGSGSPAINQNLCSDVSCVDHNGIPIATAGGQGAVNTYNEDELSPVCVTLLPVELIHFDVTNKENNALLSWSTASEFNSKGFEILKSKDGVSWEIIAFVDGAGNSNIPLQYSYTDILNGVSGIYYYRLKQIDYDSNFELLPIRQVSIESKNVIAYSWYPNPCKDMVKFEKNTSDELNYIMISDVIGRTMYYAKVSELTDNTIKFKDQLPAGTYFISFIMNGSIQTDRIVVQN